MSIKKHAFPILLKIELCPDPVQNTLHGAFMS